MVPSWHSHIWSLTSGVGATSLMRPYYLLPFLLCLDSYAQVARPSLTGSVTDQQGRPVPSARVKAISIATGLKREVETGMQGTYALLREVLRDSDDAAQRAIAA